jgi:nitrous oxidase accessory protein
MGRVFLFPLISAFLLAVAGTAFGDAPLPPLQPLIDAASPGDLIQPLAGTYAGPVIITKAITLDGQGVVTIDNGGKGAVITIRGNGVTVQNLRLINSGDQHNDIDAGVAVYGNSNVIKDNVIQECLFGVSLQQSDNNVVRRNRISSQSDIGLGVRGDAIRLWYSKNNRIEDNTITNSRDFVVWYSADNIIANNRVSNGRYGLHFMYSRYNLVEGNTFAKNSTGIFLMYSDSVVVRKNRIVQAQGAAGIGIGFKEASNLDIVDNEILYNGTGLYLDVSPFQPGTTNRIYRNTIAFNDVGVSFLNDWHDNLFKDNRFMNNIRHVSVSTFAGANHNIWQGNYWDDYQGFDRDHDGLGDTPYRLNVYADRLWMDVPNAAFFKGSPALGFLDFMERLAPFTDPLIMLEDDQPRTHKAFTPATLAAGDANEGVRLHTFGLTTGADKAGTSMKRLDPFGLYNDKDKTDD